MQGTHSVSTVEAGRTYFVSLTPPAARELLFISTYDDEDPKSNAANKHGYQRPPMPSRFREIAGYFLGNGNRYRITPLIVSVRLTDDKEIQRFLKLLAAGDFRGIKAAFGD